MSMADDRDMLGLGKLPVDLLSDLLRTHAVTDPSVVVGPGVGRDAAIVDIGGQMLVVKTDPITFATSSAPHYLVNINANDLACLGAQPRWMLVTALFPAGETTAADVARLFAELRSACAERGISLVGGHTEVTDAVVRPVFVGQLLGIAEPERMLKPGGARPGERLLLTRGVAIEGTALLATEAAGTLRYAIGAGSLAAAAALLHDPGLSVVRDAERLNRNGVVTALHDPTEGGIAMGVREMAEASGCGAVVSRAAIIVREETQAIARALDLDPLGMLASGSLLAAVPADRMAEAETVCAEHQIPFAWIGKLTPAQHGFTLRDGERDLALPVFTTDEVARALSLLGQTERESSA